MLGRWSVVVRGRWCWGDGRAVAPSEPGFLQRHRGSWLIIIAVMPLTLHACNYGQVCEQWMYWWWVDTPRSSDLQHNSRTAAITDRKWRNRPRRSSHRRHMWFRKTESTWWTTIVNIGYYWSVHQSREPDVYYYDVATVTSVFVIDRFITHCLQTCPVTNTSIWRRPPEDVHLKTSPWRRPPGNKVKNKQQQMTDCESTPLYINTIKTNWCLD